jgi:hypothetical protein
VVASHVASLGSSRHHRGRIRDRHTRQAVVPGQGGFCADRARSSGHGFVLRRPATTSPTGRRRRSSTRRNHVINLFVWRERERRAFSGVGGAVSTWLHGRRRAWDTPRCPTRRSATSSALRGWSKATVNARHNAPPREPPHPARASRFPVIAALAVPAIAVAAEHPRATDPRRHAYPPGGGTIS